MAHSANATNYSYSTTVGNYPSNFTSPEENPFNNTSQVRHLALSSFEVTLEILGLSTITVCGSAMNFVIVYLFIKYPNSRSSASLYIMNLTAIDLISCITIIPLIIYGILVPTWTHGPTLCLVSNALVSIPYCVSFWGHLGLAVCRYCLFNFKSKICKVLLHQSSIIIAIIFMWLLNIVLHWVLLWSPYPMARVQFLPEYGICAIDTAGSEGYMVVTIVLTMTVLGPFIVCLTLYLTIACRVHRQVHSFPSQSAKQRFMQMSKYTSLLFGFFCLSWLPDYLMLTIDVDGQAPVWLIRISYFMYYLNCAANPYIYALRCEPVRKAFMRQFPRLTFLFRHTNTQVVPRAPVNGSGEGQPGTSSQNTLVPRSAIVTVSSNVR